MARMYISCPNCLNGHVEIPSPSDPYSTGYVFEKCPECRAEIVNRGQSKYWDGEQEMYYIETKVTQDK
jgi:hypothetical protein